MLRAEPNLLEVDAPITGKSLDDALVRGRVMGRHTNSSSLRRHPRAICTHDHDPSAKPLRVTLTRRSTT